MRNDTRKEDICDKLKSSSKISRSSSCWNHTNKYAWFMGSHVEDTKSNSNNVPNGHCSCLFGYGDLQYPHIILIMVSFFGPVFCGCFLSWRIRSLFAFGSHRLSIGICGRVW